MVIIQEVIISDDIFKQYFKCNLDACKGACCWEGDFGAPINTSEMQKLEEIFDDIKPYLTKEGLKAIEEKGLYTYFEQPKEYGTTLLENGACAYLTYLDNGIAVCGIEQAYRDGKTNYMKPLSCHLYPIRISENRHTGMEILEYDIWDICSKACDLGKKEKLPIYKFVKDAIVRKYGADFYDELLAAGENLFEKND